MRPITAPDQMVSGSKKVDIDSGEVMRAENVDQSVGTSHTSGKILFESKPMPDVQGDDQ